MNSFANFTPRAQRVIQLARREADSFNHPYVGTEHLLLGLIALGEGVAVNVLERMGVVLDTVRHEVEKAVGQGPEPLKKSEKSSSRPMRPSVWQRNARSKRKSPSISIGKNSTGQPSRIRQRGQGRPRKGYAGNGLLLPLGARLSLK